MPSDRDAIAEAIRDVVHSPIHTDGDRCPGCLVAADAVQPFIDAARAEGYQAAISDARKAVDALRREWGTGTNPESADYGDPQVQQFGEFVLAVFDKPDHHEEQQQGEDA